MHSRRTLSIDVSRIGFGLALLVYALIGGLPSTANAHEVDSVPVVVQDHVVDSAEWCVHGDGAEDPSTGHGTHCFAPAFASMSSADHTSWFAVNLTCCHPTEDVERHGLTVGAEPPPPRTTS